MTIKNIYVIHIQLPFQPSFLYPQQKHLYSDSLVLELQTSTGVRAYGVSNLDPSEDSHPLPRVQKEVAEVLLLLENFVFESLYDIKEFVQEDLSQKMKAHSLCALEMALLSAWAQEQKQLLPELFKVELPEALPYIGVLPAEKLSLFRPHVQNYSFQKIKLNINRDLSLSLENIQTLRSIFGEGVEIQVDMGGSWLAEDALEQIPDLLDEGIRVFEQPFDTTQDLRMAKLQRRYRGELEFVADESLMRYKDAVRLIKREACTRFNLNMVKQGGFFNTLSIYQLATQYGIQCELGMHGGESGLLRNMGMLFAAHAPELVHTEFTLTAPVLQEDICKKTIHTDLTGNLIVPHDIFSPKNRIEALDIEKYSVKTSVETES